MYRRMLMLLFVSGVFCADGAIDDVCLRSTLRTMFMDRHSITGQVQGVLSQLNFASNRIVDAAKDVYCDDTADARQKGRAISLVSTYGAPEDVGFVISCASNRAYFVTSALGVVNLLGLGSNSLFKVSRLIQEDYGLCDDERRLLDVDKGYLVERILSRARNADAEVRELSFCFALSFASNFANQVESTDTALTTLVPDYRNSRRRLGLLRYLLPRVSNASQTNYIAAAINDMVAYPESDLPE